MNTKQLFALVLFCGSAGFSFANNTSGVHGPVIKPGERSWMLRTSFSPGEDGGEDRQAYRLHYQQAINADFRWRVIGQFRDRGEFEYDYLRAELLWFFKPKRDTDWDSAVRFDIRTRDGDRPEEFGINWTNQWALTPKWRLRGILIGSWEFGGDAQSGTFAETRASLTYKLDSGHRVGVEMFNELGRADDMGSFSDQSHQIGPVVSGKLGGFSYQLGYLAGVSDSAREHDLRVWISKSL